MATVTLPESPAAAPILADAPAERPFVEEPLYEVVNGKKVELPPMATSSSRVASILAEYLSHFARVRGLGRVQVETLYWIGEAGNLKRRPDVSFVSYERWPMTCPIGDEEAWDVVPELAVEVVSPTDRADDLLEKIEEYFDAGVLQTWVVYPRRRVVHVYHAFDQIVVVKEPANLLGCPPLPDFSLPVADLFVDLAPKVTRPAGRASSQSAPDNPGGSSAAPQSAQE